MSFEHGSPVKFMTVTPAICWRNPRGSPYELALVEPTGRYGHVGFRQDQDIIRSSIQTHLLGANLTADNGSEEFTLLTLNQYLCIRLRLVGWAS